MTDQSHDDLDRLLFALPLEEPPSDLRSQILAATVYQPAFPFKVWETWILGGLMALAVWLTIMIVQGGAAAFSSTLFVILDVFSRQLLAEGTLLWLAVGGGIAFVLLILNLGPMPTNGPKPYSGR